MEYVADRLGLIFMKINGPALGHNVLSLGSRTSAKRNSKTRARKTQSCPLRWAIM